MAIEITSEEFKPMSLEYKIPEDIRKNIPSSFWLALGGEITSVFGVDVWKMYEGQRVADYICGTAGLHFAVKMACWKLDMMWLYKYYDSLDWYESDQFDSIVTDAAGYSIADKSVTTIFGFKNPYFLWMMKKEW